MKKKAVKKTAVTRVSAEDTLAAALEANPIPGLDLTREYRFQAERRWRFDFAFPRVSRSTVDGQRHRTFAGIRSDCEKLNEAARLGGAFLGSRATRSRRLKSGQN